MAKNHATEYGVQLCNHLELLPRNNTFSNENMRTAQTLIMNYTHSRKQFALCELHVFLADLMSWRDTSLGYDFWEQVYRTLNEHY